MRHEDAEDLWLACVMQAPSYARHSRVSKDHLTVRGQRILAEIERVAEDGWSTIDPSQLRGLPWDYLGTIPRRIEHVDAPSTIDQAETALIDAWVKVRYAQILRETAEVCLEEGIEVAEAKRMEGFAEIEAHTAGMHWVTAGEAARELHRNLQRGMAGSERSNFHNSGLAGLDEAVKWWQPERMTVIGSYTSQGKSTITIQILTGLAIRGTKVAYISLEDPPSIVAKRQVVSRVDEIAHAVEIANDTPSVEALDSIVDLIEGVASSEVGGLDTLPFEILYRKRFTIDWVCYAIQDAARRGAKVVAVDYLQCLKDKRYKRTEFLSECVSRMKSAACEVGVHLILVSQVTRPEDKAKPARPTMYMLKETGDIENEAEYVVLPYRDEKGKEGEFEMASVFIDKAKDGRAPLRLNARWDTRRNDFSIERTSGGWS